MAAVAGLLFLSVSFLFLRLLHLGDPRLSPFFDAWHRFAPAVPYLGTCFFSFAIAYPVAALVNLCTDGVQIREHEINEHGSDLEKLVNKAVGTAYSDPHPYMLTLSSGKVYVGIITSDNNPYGDRSHLTLLKLQSGFRNDEHRVVITTEYAQIIQQIRDQDGEVPGRVTVEDLNVVVPTSEVVQISRYEPDLRQLFPE
jgi:hypothetical protein